jgi:hypothetical protein
VRRLGGAIATLGPIPALFLYAFHVLLYMRHVNDDAFITFRYSRFLASGLGPYFNIGEHVEGYTNFLLMLLMAPVHAMGGEAAVPLAAKALGIASGGSALVVGALVARRLAEAAGFSSTASGPVVVLATCLVALFPGFAVNSTSGLETALYAFLVTLAVYLGLGKADGRWWRTGTAWSAAALTRPEAVAIFGIWWLVWGLIGVAVARRESGRFLRAHLATAVVVIGVVFAHLVFRLLVYDGEWLPNTFHAKAGGFVGMGALEYVHAGGFRPFLGPIGVLTGVVGWTLVRGAVLRGLPVAAAGLAGVCLPFAIGTDWMPGWRFSVPYLPLLAGVVALGWMNVLRPATTRLRAVGPAAALLLLAGTAWLHYDERRELAQEINLRARGYATGHVALANWIRDEGTRPGDTVALMEPAGSPRRLRRFLRVGPGAGVDRHRLDRARRRSATPAGARETLDVDRNRTEYRGPSAVPDPLPSAAALDRIPLDGATGVKDRGRASVRARARRAVLPARRVQTIHLSNELLTRNTSPAPPPAAPRSTPSRRAGSDRRAVSVPSSRESHRWPLSSTAGDP